MDRDYVLVAGSGRSGTNLTLDLLDASDRTYCRNEPYSETGRIARIAGLGQGYLPGDVPAAALEEWRGAMGHLAVRSGARDRFAPRPKIFFRPAPLPQLGQALYGRARLRALLGAGGLEWRCPGLYFNARLAEALPVFKILTYPSWIARGAWRGSAPAGSARPPRPA